jgi:hypothetical protein
MRVMKTLLALALAFIALPTLAANVTLRWIPPTTCADGSAITGCPAAGFEISEGSSATGTMAIKENVGPGVTSITYQNIAPGTTKCYSLKTYTGSGVDRIKSDESTRACVTVPLLPPKAPSGVTVTVEVTVSTP